MKKLLSVLLAVLLIAVNIPIIVSAVAAPAPFVVTTNVEGDTVKRGDTIQVSVTMGENYTGYAVGTYFFKVSDNLVLDTDFVDEDENELTKAVAGVNKDAYGCPFMSTKNIKFLADQNVITAQFIVKDDAVGDVSIDFYVYELIDKDAAEVEYTINGNADPEPIKYSVEGVELTFTSDADDYFYRGETVTFTVKTGDTNPGFNNAELYFAPSSGLTPAGGQDLVILLTGEYYWSISSLKDTTNTDLYSIKFKVNDDATGPQSVTFYTQNVTLDGVECNVLINGGSTSDTISKDVYISVEDITLDSNECEERVDFNLDATVTPADSVASTIVWSVKDAGETGATISGNVLSTEKMGTAVITATVEGGLKPTEAFTKDFTITVDMEYAFEDAIYDLSNAVYEDVLQSDANTEEEVKAVISGTLDAVLKEYSDISYDITFDSFTPAVEGSATTSHEGTDGSAEFSVTISKLTNEYTQSGNSISIAATPFTGKLDSERVDDAITAINNGILGDVEQDSAEDEDAVLADLKAQAESLISDPSVNVEIVKVSYDEPVAGTSADPAGTNGSVTFKVKVTKGSATGTSDEKTVEVVATLFDGTSDAEAVVNAKNGMTGAELDVDFPGSDDIKLAAVKAFVDNKLTEIEHTPGVTASVVKKSEGIYTVTFTKGAENKSGDYPFSFNVAPDPDIAIIADAMAVVEGILWENLEQEDAEDQEAAIATIKTIVEEAIGNSDIAVEINVSNFDAAVPSDRTSYEHDGTSGEVQFNVTLSKGAQSDTSGDVTLDINATYFDGVLDCELLAEVRALVESMTFDDVAQSEVNTSDAVANYVKNLVETTIDNSEVTVEVSVDSFTAAIKGSAKTSHEGTNGVSAFTVSLTVGAENDDVSSALGIIATTYDGYLDSEVAEIAKAVMAGIAFEDASQSSCSDDLGSRLYVAKIISNAISEACSDKPHSSVSDVRCGNVTFTPAVAGSAATTHEGTNGSFKFTPFLKIGSLTVWSPVSNNLTIIATPYTGLLDSEIIDYANEVIDNTTFEAYNQEDINTAVAANADIKSKIEDGISALVGDDVHTDYTVSVDTVDFVAAVAGSATTTHEGTNGSYTFTISVECGAESVTSNALTVEIVATEYVELLDSEVIEIALTVYSTLTIDDVSQNTCNDDLSCRRYVENAVKDAIEEACGGKAHSYIKYSCTNVFFVEAVAGSAATSHEGTNGSFKTQPLIKIGSLQAQSPYISFNIIANTYDELLDSEVITAISDAIDNAEFDDYDQADKNNQTDIHSDILDIIDALVSEALGTSEHSDCTVTVSAIEFSAAIAGSASTTNEGTDGYYTFKVTAQCGEESYESEEITVTINATEYEGLLDTDVLDMIIEEFNDDPLSSLKQEDANSAADANETVKSQAEDIIEQLLGDYEHSDYTVTITDVGFEAAEAGSASTSHDGENGCYTFSITVECGDESVTIGTISLEIEATKYEGYLDTEAVDYSKNYILNNSITIKQSEANTKDTVESKLDSIYEAELSEYGVDVSVTVSEITPAVAGSKATTHEGTDGSAKYTVTVTSGAESYTSAQLTAVIKATRYDGVLDSEALQSIVDAIQNFDLEVEKGASDSDKQSAVLEFVKGQVPSQYASSATVEITNVAENVYTVKVTYAGLSSSKDITVNITEKSNSNSIWNQIILAYLNLQNKTFVVNASANEGGKISDAGKTKVKFGEYLTYTITPDEGYTVKSVIVNGKDRGAVTTIKLSDIRTNYTIEVVFEKVQNEWINPFVDIFETDAYYDAIKYVNENNLFKGTSDITFSPDKTMTRAMFVTVLGRLSGVDISEFTNSSFSDVESGTYYAEYVEWAAKNNIVNGYGNGKFQPNKEINVQEAIVIIARYAEFINNSVESANDLSAYSDGNQVASWAAVQMAWALDNGIYTVAENELAPSTPASRALVATLLYNFASKFVK